MTYLEEASQPRRSCKRRKGAQEDAVTRCPGGREGGAREDAREVPGRTPATPTASQLMVAPHMLAIASTASRSIA